MIHVTGKELVFIIKRIYAKSKKVDGWIYYRLDNNSRRFKSPFIFVFGPHFCLNFIEMLVENSIK